MPPTALLVANDSSPPLKSGDELVFVARPYPISTALVIKRDGGAVMMWDSPIGPVPARSLGARLDRPGCEERAREYAERHGLAVAEVFESEEGLHVRVREV